MAPNDSTPTHELTHALLARSHGLRVKRIVFHGLQAHTVVDDDAAPPSHEALIALAGPATNLVLAGLAQAVRIVGNAQGPLDAFLLMLAVGNGAAALLSLLPLGASDVARALSAARRSGCLEREIAGQSQDQNDLALEPKASAVPTRRDRQEASARTAPLKHAMGGFTRPAPICPTPGRREAMPVLIWGRMPVCTTIRTSTPVGVPRKFRIGSV